MNTLYEPPLEEKIKLNFYQEQYCLYHAELAYQTKGMDPGNKYLFKERSHSNVRATWRLIVNEDIFYSSEEVV